MHEDRHPSLRFHVGKNIWKCFVCDKGGGPINLVMEHQRLEFIPACQWLCRQYGIYLPNNPIRKRFLPPLTNLSEPRATESTFNREIGEWLIENARLSDEACQFLFHERKLSVEVVKRLNIKSVSHPYKLIDALRSCFNDDELESAGYIGKSNDKYYLRLPVPCLLFPYYDTECNLIGIQTRTLGEVPANKSRFHILTGFKPTIFNLPQLRDIPDSGTVHIAEGVTDCMALLSDGYKAIAIPSASNLPLQEIRNLSRFNIVMAVDRDEPGENAYQKLSYEIINKGGRISKMEFPQEFKDYGDFHKSQS